MADTPQTGRPEKVINQDILRVLENAEEIHGAPVMTVGDLENYVDGSRPTVNKYVKELNTAGEVNSGPVGNATAYWVEEAPESTASGPSVSGGAAKPEENLSSSLRRLLGHNRGQDRQALPGILVVVLLAVLGWHTYKAALKRATGRSRVIDTESGNVNLVGLGYLGLLGGSLVAISGYAAWIALQFYTSAVQGLALHALGYLIGFAVYLAVLYYAAGGPVGASARTAEYGSRAARRLWNAIA